MRHRQPSCVRVAAVAAVVTAAAAGCGNSAGTTPHAAPAETSTSSAPPPTVIGGGASNDSGTQVLMERGAMIARRGTSVSVYDPTSGNLRWRGDNIRLSPDRRTAVETDVAAGAETIVVRDVDTGVAHATWPQQSRRELVAVSTHGELAALVDPLTIDDATGMPQGRTTSHIDIVDLLTGSLRRSFTLPGNLVPETIDAQSGLGVVEYTPSDHPDRYRVRHLELVTGQLTNVLTRDKTEIVDDMYGYGRSAVASSDGQTLFTLYHQSGGGNGSFIHQLLQGGLFAFCIDLPPDGYRNTNALTLSPDDNTLYVAGTDGRVAVLGSRDANGAFGNELLSERQIHGPRGEPKAIAASATSLWLLADGKVWQVDRTNNAILDHFDVGADARGLGVSADETTRYVVTSSGTAIRF